MAIRSNIRLLHSMKEGENNRRIPYREISAETGMTKAQISRWMNDQIDNFSRTSIEKLCNYYNCLPGDLIVKTDD